MPNPRESCRFVNIEYSNLTLKYVLSSFANRPPERRIDFTNDESCRPVQIVSIRQHLIPLFNALGRKKVHFNIQNILTMDLRPFYALRKWKVYVVSCSFYPYFHTLLTPLDFRYVNARLYFRCVDSSTAVDESLWFGCIGRARQPRV